MACCGSTCGAVGILCIPSGWRHLPRTVETGLCVRRSSKKGVNQRARGEKNVGNAQALAVKVQGGIFVNEDASPRARENFYEILVQTAIEQRIPENKALWRGDFNETPSRTATNFLENSRLRQAVQDKDDSPLPTRWQGTARIDYFMTARSWEVERSGLLVHTTVNMEDCEPEPTTKIRTGWIGEHCWAGPRSAGGARWRRLGRKVTVQISCMWVMSRWTGLPSWSTLMPCTGERCSRCYALSARL